MVKISQHFKAKDRSKIKKVCPRFCLHLVTDLQTLIKFLNKLICFAASRFHKFWPDVRQSVTAATHSICTKSETCIQDHATLTKRICQLNRHGYTHPFTQFQCAVNDLNEVDPNDMVWLARTIFHMICYKTPMIVIQTTDGQGLSGVLVALLKILEEIVLGKVNVVNVYETVLALGQYKQNMVI